MGHSFQYSIMDFYTRFNHMQGKDSYWQVGSDHAGIATQMVVENNLSKNNITRKDLGREKFIKEFGHGKTILKKISLHKLRGWAVPLIGINIDLLLMTDVMTL